MISDAVRIFVCTEPVDMRFGFDRLAQVARERIGEDPVAGSALFVFAGKKATRLKLLWFERNGLCLLYKRLSHNVSYAVNRITNVFASPQILCDPKIESAPCHLAG
jgi:transposase